MPIDIESRPGSMLSQYLYEAYVVDISIIPALHYAHLQIPIFILLCERPDRCSATSPLAYGGAQLTAHARMQWATTCLKIMGEKCKVQSFSLKYAGLFVRIRALSSMIEEVRLGRRGDLNADLRCEIAVAMTNLYSSCGQG
jgi:hypothetical protein